MGHTMKHRNFLKAFAAMLCLAALLCAVGCSCSAQSSSAAAISTLSASAEPVVSQESSSAAAEKIQMPVDFAALQEQNEDVYAWLYIPNTAVNYPVAQNWLLDNYYLYRNIYGEEDELGALYTQSANARDFMDPVTIIYGHTYEHEGVVSDDMMGSLHKYNDQAFFDENPDMYIFTADKILKYEIIAAYEYDDRHILNSYDFNDMEVVQAYFDYVQNPDSMIKYVRAHDRLEAGKDRIVQLSTCTHPLSDTGRWIVTGVLVDEQSAE